VTPEDLKQCVDLNKVTKVKFLPEEFKTDACQIDKRAAIAMSL
jgi:hypothetical protein